MALEVGDEEGAARRDPRFRRPRIGDDPPDEGGGDPAAAECLGDLRMDGDQAVPHPAIVDPAGQLVAEVGLVAVRRRNVFDRQLGRILRGWFHPGHDSGPQAGGSGSSISGTRGWPVISREPRPWVKKLHAHRTTTTRRLAKPIRYTMWIPSHSDQAMNPLWRPNGPSQPMFVTP